MGGYYSGANALAAMIGMTSFIHRMQMMVATWISPSQRIIRGANNTVTTVRELDRLAANSNLVTLYSALSKLPRSGYTLSASTARSLAAAGGRGNYPIYLFRVPQAVANQLEKMGLLTRRQTLEAGVWEMEYFFKKGASLAYIIERFFVGKG